MSKSKHYSGKTSNLKTKKDFKKSEEEVLKKERYYKNILSKIQKSIKEGQLKEVESLSMPLLQDETFQEHLKNYEKLFPDLSHLSWIFRIILILSYITGVSGKYIDQKLNNTNFLKLVCGFEGDQPIFSKNTKDNPVFSTNQNFTSVVPNNTKEIETCLPNLCPAVKHETITSETEDKKIGYKKKNCLNNPATREMLANHPAGGLLSTNPQNIFAIEFKIDEEASEKDREFLTRVLDEYNTLQQKLKKYLQVPEGSDKKKVVTLKMIKKRQPRIIKPEPELKFEIEFGEGESRLAYIGKFFNFIDQRNSDYNSVQYYFKEHNTTDDMVNYIQQKTDLEIKSLGFDSKEELIKKVISEI